jgi:hypothetical protein
MSHFGARLGRKLEHGIMALLTQPTVEKAAGVAGISPRTLHRWMQMPEFQAAYRQVRRDALSQSLGRLQWGSSAAASVLLKLTVDPSTPASVRVRAADSVLNHAMKAMENEDIKAVPLPKGESDQDLPTGPRMELPRILSGIVETVVYRREFFDDPQAMGPTGLDHHASDRLQEFLRDRCIMAAEGNIELWKEQKWWVPVTDLYPTYAAWAAAAGEKQPLPKGFFEERLHQLGREKERVRPDGRRATKQIWVWLGIRFNTSEEN